jgi:hypothetical protein
LSSSPDRDAHMAAWLDALQAELGQRPAPFSSTRYGPCLRVWLGGDRSAILPLPSEPPTPGQVFAVMDALRRAP